MHRSTFYDFSDPTFKRSAGPTGKYYVFSEAHLPYGSLRQGPKAKIKKGYVQAPLGLESHFIAGRYSIPIDLELWAKTQLKFGS